MSDENSLITLIENCVQNVECETFKRFFLFYMFFVIVIVHSIRMRHFHNIHISTPTKFFTYILKFSLS